MIDGAFGRAGLAFMMMQRIQALLALVLVPPSLPSVRRPYARGGRCVRRRDHSFQLCELQGDGVESANEVRDDELELFVFDFESLELYDGSLVSFLFSC